MDRKNFYSPKKTRREATKNMQKTKNKIILLCAVTVAFAALMAVASFYDLEISRKLSSLKEGEYYARGLFERLFETIGALPLFITVDFAAAVIFHSTIRGKRNAGATIVLILICLACLCVNYYCFYQIFKYLSHHYGVEQSLGGITDAIAYFLLGGLTVGAVFYFTKEFSNDFLNKVRPWATAVLFIALFSQVTVQSLKVFSGRMRYCAMNADGDFSSFTNWFVFMGKRVSSDQRFPATDVYKSFPSGHASAAAMSLSFLFFPFYSFKNKKVAFTVACVICSAFTVCAMLARIISGAHFLSDVVFGAYTTFLFAFVFTALVPKIFNKFFKQNALSFDENGDDN